MRNSIFFLVPHEELKTEENTTCSRDAGTTGKKLPHLGILFTYVYYFEFQSINIISLLAIGFVSYNLQKNWYMYYVMYVYVMTRILLMKWA